MDYVRNVYFFSDKKFPDLKKVFRDLLFQKPCTLKKNIQGLPDKNRVFLRTFFQGPLAKICNLYKIFNQKSWF